MQNKVMQSLINVEFYMRAFHVVSNMRFSYIPLKFCKTLITLYDMLEFSQSGYYIMFRAWNKSNNHFNWNVTLNIILTAKIGPIFLHGPHQTAKKSMTIKVSFSSARSLSNCSYNTEIIRSLSFAQIRIRNYDPYSIWVKALVLRYGLVETRE